MYVLQTLDESRLPALYAEFLLQDRREIDFKKRKVEGVDADGEEEALIRRKFLGQKRFLCPRWLNVLFLLHLFIFHIDVRMYVLRITDWH